MIDNKSTLWEFIKCKIRSETMVYSCHKAKLRKQRECELQANLEKLEKNLKTYASNPMGNFSGIFIILFLFFSLTYQESHFST